MWPGNETQVDTPAGSPGGGARTPLLQQDPRGPSFTLSVMRRQDVAAGSLQTAAGDGAGVRPPPTPQEHCAVAEAGVAEEVSPLRLLLWGRNTPSGAGGLPLKGTPDLHFRPAYTGNEDHTSLPRLLIFFPSRDN